jgi:long-chain acyl-CoA synthetase
VASKNFLIRSAFWTAFKAKEALLSWKWTWPAKTLTPVFNPIFKEIRAATGGDVRATVSGGAPLAKETQKFLTVTHAPLLVGYGLTETTAYGWCL